MVDQLVYSVLEIPHGMSPLEIQKLLETLQVTATPELTLITVLREPNRNVLIFEDSLCNSCYSCHDDAGPSEDPVLVEQYQHILNTLGGRQ